MATDITELRKWGKLGKATQNRLLSNVFCAECFVTTAVDYEIVDRKDGVLIKGKYKTCGQNVARVVEEDWFSHEAN